jgi:two-component system, NtrC family, sensor kinase
LASEVLEQVKQLLEGSVDAAVILDADRTILYYNRAYEALSGLRGRKLARRVEEGARCFEIFPLEICESECLGCKARDSSRALRVDEIKAVRGKDGEELTFIVAAVPMGEGVVIETYRDVTADVRIQRRLKVLLDRERRAKEILEDEVRERTHELRQAQAQLVHQEKMSSLGRLVAGIAHELNNPINFVYGNVDFLGQYMEDLLSLVGMLDGADLTPEVRKRLDEMKDQIEFDFLVDDSRKLIRSIRSGAERTAGIVQDLKSFSRTRSSELQEADVAAGIDTTLNLIAPLLKNRITVERRIAGNLPRLVCNAGHINQVFMNILTNAAQAIDGEGTIRVVIDTIGDGSQIQVAISDSGPGIAPEIAEKITDPFFTTKDVGEGTGLGLWISENIVRAHGGTLTCISQPGRGATFTVTLPVRAPESALQSMTDDDEARARAVRAVIAAAEGGLDGT